MQLIIDLSGREGLAPRFFGDVGSSSSSPNLRYLGAKGQVAEGVYNPLRKYGYMCASEATFSDVTVASGAPGETFTTSIYDPVNDDFYVSGGQKVYKGTDLTVSDVASVLDLGSTGTPTMLDFEIYMINDVQRLFYLYEKGGNMLCGEAVLPFASANSDWLDTDVSGAFTNGLTNASAFMRVADNGFMYIFQDNNIHVVDGTGEGGATGTVTANVIQFPITFSIIDAIDYKGYIMVLIKQTTKLTATKANVSYGVYVWDRQSTVVNSRDYIPLTGIDRAHKIYVAPNGNVRLMVTKPNEITEIREYTGATFKPIQEVGINAQPESLDGLTQMGELTVWLSNDKYVLAHGSILPGEKEGLFRLGKIVDASSITAGAIIYGNNGLYLSYLGQAFEFVHWNINGTTTAAQGDIYTLVQYLPQMSTVKNVEIYCSPITNTGTTKVADIKTYFNQSTTAFKTHNADRDQVSRGYVDFELNKPFVNSIQLEIEHSTNGTNEFCPSFAVVEYEPTKTKGSKAS